MSPLRFLCYISIHALALCLGTWIFACWAGVPLEWSVMQWDVYWYKEIAEVGYTFDPKQHSSVAFFPLLPWVIALLMLSIPLTVTFNSFVSVLALRRLSLFSDDSKDLILFLSLPLILYFIVPYTEALFLLGSVLLLSGLQSRKSWMVVAGALIAILTRYAATLLVPALILTAVYECLHSKEKTRETLRLYGTGIAALLLGLLLVSWYQYEQTGVWTGYQQTHMHWGHALSIPQLPFYSEMGSSMLLLDQVALLISVLSAIALLLALWCRYKKDERIAYSPIQFISLCYLAGTGASMILFQGGSLDSLGRYTFATAFIFPLLPVIRTFSYKPVQLIYLFIGCSLFFLGTGSLGSVTHFLANEGVAFILTLTYFLMHLNPTKSVSWNHILIWAGGVSIQSVLFLLYLTGNWVE